MRKHITDILGSPDSFLQTIFQNLQQINLDVSNYELDHICYRVETEKDYQEKKIQLSDLGELLVESLIGGRPISTFKLNDPIEYLEREIYLVELPAPKSGSKYQEGFEHVEFVIDKSLEEFKAQYQAIDFDEKGFQKEINADLRIGFGKSSVKFHEHNLEYVIKYLD